MCALSAPHHACLRRRALALWAARRAATHSAHCRAPRPAGKTGTAVVLFTDKEMRTLGLIMQATKVRFGFQKKSHKAEVWSLCARACASQVRPPSRSHAARPATHPGPAAQLALPPHPAPSHCRR